MQIKSSTTLRNDYISISNLAHETGEPVYITKNGEGDLVVLSIEAYEERMQLEKLMNVLDDAEQQILEGEHMYSVDELEKYLESIIENG